MNSLILVDIDGVLNPEYSSKDHVEHNIEGFKVLLNPSHGSWLVKLAEETNSDLVWCTYWQDLAPVYVAPLVGLPEMPFISIATPISNYHVGLNKAIAAKHYAGERRFVMLEDESNVQLHLKGSNGIQVYVSPDFGLQESHIQQAYDYLIS